MSDYDKCDNPECKNNMNQRCKCPMPSFCETCETNKFYADHNHGQISNDNEKKIKSTFTETGPNYMNQYYYNCKQCNDIDKNINAICQFCIKPCKASGHTIRLCYGASFCDKKLINNKPKNLSKIILDFFYKF